MLRRGFPIPRRVSHASTPSLVRRVLRECVDGVTVRVGVAKEDFERAFFGSHFLNREAREEREGLFFEFEQANVFQIHGTACRALG